MNEELVSKEMVKEAVLEFLTSDNPGLLAPYVRKDVCTEKHKGIGLWIRLVSILMGATLAVSGWAALKVTTLGAAVDNNTTVVIRALERLEN